MGNRIGYGDGNEQQNRMIVDKLRSLRAAIKYSYQGAHIIKDGKTISYPALINPSKVNESYDEKIVSVEFDYGFTTGDVFTWTETDTKWLIYLQELTELAYFRGNIRRCNYSISWIDDDGGTISSYISLIGPSEGSIDSTIRESTSVDSPNYTLEILMPKTTDSLEFFRRYSKFYLQGLDEGEEDKC